jgi:hypothetical protein
MCFNEKLGKFIWGLILVTSIGSVLRLINQCNKSKQHNTTEFSERDAVILARKRAAAAKRAEKLNLYLKNRNYGK